MEIPHELYYNESEARFRKSLGRNKLITSVQKLRQRVSDASELTFVGLSEVGELDTHFLPE